MNLAILPRRVCRGSGWVIVFYTPGISRYHCGRVDDDFAARFACEVGIRNSDLHGLSHKTCREVCDRFPHGVEGPDPKSDPAVPAHALV
jgi:hypothetical protein